MTSRSTWSSRPTGSSTAAPAAAPRPAAGVRWPELTEEKIAAIPLLTALRSRGSATTRLPG